jgi:hypothetical protein
VSSVWSLLTRQLGSNGSLGTTIADGPRPRPRLRLTFLRFTCHVPRISHTVNPWTVNLGPWILRGPKDSDGKRGDGGGWWLWLVNGGSTFDVRRQGVFGKRREKTAILPIVQALNDHEPIGRRNDQLPLRSSLVARRRSSPCFVTQHHSLMPSPSLSPGYNPLPCTTLDKSPITKKAKKDRRFGLGLSHSRLSYRRLTLFVLTKRPRPETNCAPARYHHNREYSR